MNTDRLGRIHSTESFGTVDGPGIRFVVFMQGCPMRCAYCHNPDTRKNDGGTLRSTEDILKEYESYQAFLKDGGLTVTGGEPLLQIEFVTELFIKAKQRGIHTCLDTSGVTYCEEKRDVFKKLLQVTDLVMLDIKQINPTKHKELTKHDNRQILQFAQMISDYGVKLWVRYVAVPNLTDDEDDLIALGRFLAKLKSLQALDVLPYHTMGEVKYQNLGIKYPLEGIEPMDKEQAMKVRTTILRARKEQLKMDGGTVC